MTRYEACATDEEFVLVLQGGGALGAYQAGAFAALCEAGCAPDWVAGISIGAINGAIVAGNRPDDRVPKLRSFWDMVSSSLTGQPLGTDMYTRKVFNQTSAAMAVGFGIPGFFYPRMPPAALYPPGIERVVSYYDTGPLRETIEGLVDFDLLNRRAVRLSVGAVHVRSGNFAYFDSAKQTLGPEHIMASGALPPGFPPVEVDGELYWDGGLVSNTPLHHVLERCGEPRDMCIFQIDLFSASGEAPETLLDVAMREKAIRYSSRTRLNTDNSRKMQTMRRAVKRLLSALPDGVIDKDDRQLLADFSSDAAVTIVHLIHRPKEYTTQSMDYEFSRLSIEEHWAAGEDDVRRTLRHKNWRDRCKPKLGVNVLDLTRDEAKETATHEHG